MIKQCILSLLCLLWAGQTVLAGELRERVYLQTDKQFYLSGELVWMKFIATDLDQRLSDVSKVGYVELLDSASAVVQARLVLEKGVGNGCLQLPSTLPTGNYRLVAYTRYMRNEGEEVFFEKPLAEISFGHVLLNLFNTARRFNMEVQPQLVLLQKTLLYVEGVGRQLYPQLDLWKTAKPFLESWIKDQVGIPALVRSLKEKGPFWIEKMPEIPELVYDSLRQSKNLQHSMDKIARELQSSRVRQGQSRYLFGIGATLLLSGTLLLINRPDWQMMPAWLMAGGVVVWLAGWRKTR